MKTIIGLMLICMAFTANAQTPPVSTIGDIPDTVTSLDIVIPFTVASDIQWDNEMVGVYWRVEGVTDWMYAGAGRQSIIWTAPTDDTLYQFSTQVQDNEGNAEAYHQVKGEVFTCLTCIQSDCPPQTMLGLASDAAALGVMSWGTANVPTVEWYWTHPTTGSQVVSYTMELEILTAAGDTTRATFPGLTEMDSLYGYGRTPYPVIGEQQRVRVSGKDDQDRTGLPAVFSAWFGDDGPPGQPGTALKHLVMEGP